MPRRNDRAAWTAHIEGKPVKKPAKYGNEKVDGYDSKREAAVGANLYALECAGQITNLQRQVPIVLIKGRGKVRDLTYLADFTFDDSDGHHIMDAKGMKTQVYLIKKKILFLLHGLEIEEV